MSAFIDSISTGCFFGGFAIALAIYVREWRRYAIHIAKLRRVSAEARRPFAFDAEFMLRLFRLRSFCQWRTIRLWSNRRKTTYFAFEEG